MMSFYYITYLWLIPAFPLLAALAIVSLPASWRRSSVTLAITGQIAALILSLLSLYINLQPPPGIRIPVNILWFSFGNQPMRIGWVLDPLTAVMLLMITLVGLCIFIFSIGYMSADKNFTRFFAYLSFFSAAMLGVIIANSLLLLFVCWELVGLASYLLIGFWIDRPSAAAAAKKAFITTRIGDLGLFLGMMWLYHQTGTLLFYDRGGGCLENAALLSLGSAATPIALMIFCGAIGKSGQFPLHVWLPDAMEGPTPVSALIHAATMVAAGVFLVARVYPIFSAGAIDGVTPALGYVVWIGVITGLMAALIAIGQSDIKRILAYSTVSQLGLMMVSLGVGGVAAGIMHLLAHGFFKALLFLGAGSVIHGLHHEQDIRKMGGLRKAMPVTFLTYAVGMMALSGVPFFFSGAWTKEAILHATEHWPKSHVPHYLMMLGVVLTAFYMTRQMIYVFFGNRSTVSETAHESPPVMTIPLMVLAICTVVFGIWLTPAWPVLERYLNPQPHNAPAGSLFQPMLFVSLMLVLAGVGLAILVYHRVTPRVDRDSTQPDPLEQLQPGVFRFLERKMWIDEVYQESFIFWSRTMSRLSDWMDRCFWDGLVRLVGKLGEWFGVLTKGVDERAINAGVDETANAGRGFGRLLATAHSGQIQRYLGIIAIGMLALLLFYAWLA